MMRRQTVVSQFYQLDRLVVEGGKSVSGFFLVWRGGCEGWFGERRVLWGLVWRGGALANDWVIYRANKRVRRAGS